MQAGRGKKGVSIFENREKALSLDHSRGEKVGGKVIRWAKAMVKCPVGGDKGWILVPKSELWKRKYMN